MKSQTRVLFATVGMWLVVAVALGYWRMFYAWRWGAAIVFFFQYMPLLVLILAVILFRVSVPQPQSSEKRIETITIDLRQNSSDRVRSFAKYWEVGKY